MHKTRLSLLYPASYLLVSGVALLLAPRFSLQLLLSNGEYDDIFPRVAGMFLFGLGILVVQIIRHRVEVMYSATVIVRIVFCACLTWFYAMSNDPFFMLVVFVVGVGLLLTLTGLVLERRQHQTYQRGQ
jgi:hypothetical protein